MSVDVSTVAEVTTGFVAAVYAIIKAIKTIISWFKKK